jgi:hypothetical protein
MTLREALGLARSQRTVETPLTHDLERWVRAGLMTLQLMKEPTVDGRRYRLQLTNKGREMLTDLR